VVPFFCFELLRICRYGREQLKYRMSIDLHRSPANIGPKLKFLENKSRGSLKSLDCRLPGSLHGCSACRSEEGVRGHSVRDRASFSSSRHSSFIPRMTAGTSKRRSMINRESRQAVLWCCPMRARRSEGEQVIDTTRHFRATKARTGQAAGLS
jgi:hypothetical protein